jgi:hypothetical protein
MLAGGPRARTICGLLLQLDDGRGRAYRTDCFPGEQLCRRCRRLLGDQAPRALNTRSPGDRAR